MYENVEVQFVPGRHAYLTIYHDGEKVEKVDLHAIPTEAQMHEMMIEKGFKMKSDDEVARIKAEKQALRDQEIMKRKHREELRRMKKLEFEMAQKKLDAENAGITDSDGSDGGEKLKGILEMLNAEDPYGDGLTPEQRADAEREMKRKKWNEVLAKKAKVEKEAASASSGGEL